MRSESKVEMSDIYNIDFWWIQEEERRSLYVGVGHHKPLTDDDQPCEIPWFRSLKNGGLSLDEEHYPLAFINEWRKACSDTNVYRTLTLFDNKGQPVVLGSFLIDIDNSQLVTNAYKEDLDDALRVARATIELLRTKPYKVQEIDLRVFFSGRKGFNIEVRPSSLGIEGAYEDQIRLSATKLDCIIMALRRCADISSDSYTQYNGFKLYGAGNAVSNNETIIDRIYGSRSNGYKLKHPYVRLHNSINEWTPKSGTKMARRKIRISLAELSGMSAEQICQKAQGDV